MKSSIVQFGVLWALFCWLGGQAQSEQTCSDEAIFPTKFEDNIFNGCIDFGDVTWCQLQNGEYMPCPQEFLTQLRSQEVVATQPAPTPDIEQQFVRAYVEGFSVPQQYNGDVVQEQQPETPPSPIKFEDQNDLMGENSVDTVAGKPVVDVFDNCDPSLGPCVIINEVMSSNDDTLVDSDGDNSDWIEFVNTEDQDVGLLGWFVSDNSNRPTKWMFPDVRVPANGMVVIFASGKDRRVPGFELHTNFRLNSRGEYLALYRPDGRISSAILPRLPPQYQDVTYGRPNLDKVGPALSALVGDSNKMSYLENPTPGLENSGPLLNGPIVISITDQIRPQPTAEDDIIVVAQLMPNFYPVTGAKMVVAINFDQKFEIEMLEGENSEYTATIPSSNFNEGDLVRWYVLATDEGLKTSRSPPFTDADYPEYYGTVVFTPDVRSQLPQFQWYVADPVSALSVEGSRSSLFFDGYLYDNIFTRRRGVTALTWPKPKIKFDFKGSVFEYNPNRAKVEEFNLQSFWMEQGEDSYMRETVAFEVLQEANVPSSDTMYVTVFMNNQFFGLFAFIEQVDDNFLERWGFNPSGYLYKSSHAEFSNLRWDQKFSDYEFIWRTANHKNQPNFVHVYNFTQGLAGGGPGTRSQYVIDHVNLPQVVNEMAVQTMMLNQDRCTKNFYVFYDVENQEWYRFPWDMESSFSISSGYGGIAAPDYCTLIGEQWNSPMYCNNEHTQDLVCIDPFTGAFVDPDPFEKTCKNKRCGENLIPTIVNGEWPSGYEIPADYDADLTNTRDMVGSRATYNHLTDAILDIPETREMYLRRLRTLMDQFLATGRIIQIFNETYVKIKDYADLDNQYWSTLALQLEPTYKGNTTHSIHRGYRQIIEEQIPRRTEQLYAIYGPGGRLPLIPEQQPADVMVEISTVNAAESDTSRHYIQLFNPNKFAVDITGWHLTGSVEFTFDSGTVIPTDSFLYVTPSLRGFRTRETSPTGYERNIVVGPWRSNLPQQGYVLTLENASGLRIDMITA